MEETYLYTEEKTYLYTEEALGSAGRLLDEHDIDIEVSEKVFETIQNIHKQLMESDDVEAYVLGTDENVKALMDCWHEPMSEAAREEYETLCGTACAINNGW